MLHVLTYTSAHSTVCDLKKISDDDDACNGVATRELMLTVATRFVCDGSSKSKTARIQETELTVKVRFCPQDSKARQEGHHV